MIARIAYQFVTSAWGRYIILALGVLVALTTWGRRRKRAGRNEARDEIIDDVRTQTERGTDAYHQNRRKNSGGSIDAALDRLRGRDDRWSRLPDIR